VGEAPICLYELRLEPDSGPSKELSVRFYSISSHLISIHRPDLYICAELFTDMDLVFVRELGINTLIRECGNAWDPKEFSRLLYRYGLRKPVGSMDGACVVTKEEIPSPTLTGKGPVRTAIVTPLNGSSPPCTAGSVKGFDDLYPKLLILVHEKRKYEITGLKENSGIAKVKRVRILNELHLEMVFGGYEEGHVH